MAWWVDAIGYLAAVLVFTAFFMRTAVNIRLFAIASNAVFVVYGLASGSLPIVVLHSLLMPLNLQRLFEMQRLTRNVRKALASDLNADWLKPYMSRRSHRAGDIVFRKGDAASELYVVESGHFKLIGQDLSVPVGDIVGELGFLHPDTSRSDGLVCIGDGALLVVSYEDVTRIYFQNPEFGLYFLKLSSRRLFANISRLEAREATLHTRNSIQDTGEAS